MMKKLLLLGLVSLLVVWLFRATVGKYMLEAKNAQG